MSRTSPIATLIGLALVGVVLRLPWALMRPWPWDWDAAYYRLTARSVASGEGGRLDVLWTLAAPEAGLGGPPDLYWLPLPSRILVPEIALGGSGLLTIFVLVAAIGPLTWMLARDLELPPTTAFVAGLLAATGGAWIRQLGSTDVYALTAIIGAIAWIGIARRRWALTLVAAAVLALTRNDGFLLGLAFSLGFVGWRALAVGAAGPVVTALWWLRGALVGGETFWKLRQASAWATSYEAIFLGSEQAPTLTERALAVLEAFWGVAFSWGWAAMLLFIPLFVWGVWSMRRRVTAWPFLAAFIVVPILTAILAPAVTLGGTLERTGTALLPMHAVILGVGIDQLATRMRDWRDYHPWFTRGLMVLAWGACAGWTGATFVMKQPPLPDCAMWDVVPQGERAFVREPLLHAWVCDAPSALLMDEVPADVVEQLSKEHAVSWAMPYPAAPRSLSTWEEVRPGVYRAP